MLLRSIAVYRTDGKAAGNLPLSQIEMGPNNIEPCSLRESLFDQEPRGIGDEACRRVESFAALTGPSAFLKDSLTNLVRKSGANP